MSFGGGDTTRKTFTSFGGHQIDKNFAQKSQISQQNYQQNMQADISLQTSPSFGGAFGQKNNFLSTNSMIDRNIFNFSASNTGTGTGAGIFGQSNQSF
jgi:hypothetical protein